MSSLNCFKPSPIGALSHKDLEGSTRFVDSSDSEGGDCDTSTVRDRISFVEDGYSVQSGNRFRSLRSESPRPESNVLVRTLKTASLSGRSRSKLKGSGASNTSSPMLSCMKGHFRKGDTPDSKRKIRVKNIEVQYDSYDTVDLQPPVTNINNSVSCLVRSHSDSTCLAVKAGKPPNEVITETKDSAPSDSQLAVSVSGSEVVRSGEGSTSSAPRSTVYSPICPNPSTPSFGYMPPSPFLSYDGYFGSPQLGGFVGVMSPPCYGTPNKSMCESGYQGATTYPSPQLSPYPLMFPCPHPYTDLFQQRPCFSEGYTIDGGPLPRTTGPRQGLYSTTPYHPAHISPAAMPMPCPSNYPRQKSSLSQQTVMSPEDRAPAAPTPIRRHVTNHQHPLPPNPLPQRIRSPPTQHHHHHQQQQPPPPLSSQQSRTHAAVQMPSSRGTAFKKLNNGAPPPYGSLGAVIGDPTNQRSHHPPGSTRPAFFSTQSPTPQLRTRYIPANLGAPVGTTVPPTVKTTSPLSSTRPSHQRTEPTSPMCQLPEFVNSPPYSCKMSPKQEAKLNQLRLEKANYEQIRQMNNRLASENRAMENQVAKKGRELKSCHLRSEQLSTQLEIIRRWCEWLTQPPGGPASRPDRSPAFEANEDTTRWKGTFDELCRLDRIIGSLRTQRRSHPTVPRLTATKPPVQSPPSDLPPKPSTERSGRHSSAGTQKRDFTPVPSPRLHRSASAPIDKELPVPAVDDGITTLPPPPPRPPLPSPSPTLHRARFASRKEITATYLTPSHWRNEHTDEYKRNASEKLQAQLASQRLQSIEALLPEAKRLSVTEAPTGVPEMAVPYFERDSASTASSSSSLETLKPAGKVDGGNGSSVIEGSEDSAIADTEGSPIVSQESPKKVGDQTGDDFGKKAILRKAVETSEEEEEGEEEEEEQEMDEKRQVEDEVEEVKERVRQEVKAGSPKTGVRFHPLALLLDAALEGDLALIKRAAAEVSDVSEANDEGITALHNAVCAGRVEVVEFLVCEAGADVNAGDTDGWTPLHCAASCANVRLARLLVEHGAALHARTLSDHETALEKCDQTDTDAECERYLAAEQELLGSADNGRVFALFPRGLEAAGPGSPDAHIESDELAIWPNEELRIVDRCPMGEPEWMLAEKVGEDGAPTGKRGLVPRAFISRFRIVRVPPASRPMPLPLPDATGRLPRGFQSSSPIDEEDDEESEDLSDTETELTRDGEGPQMVERYDDEEVADVEVHHFDPPDRQEMVLNDSTDATSAEEKVIRTAM